MENEQQGLRKEEISLIQGLFKENDYLLKVMRALFLGFELTDEEKDLIKSTFASKELMKLIWKIFCPSLHKDMEIGQIEDEWLGTEKMIIGAQPDNIQQVIQFKDKQIEMTRQAIKLLADPDGKSVDISYNPNNDMLGVSLLARSQFIRHIESQLMALKVVAGQKSETPEEEAERLVKDSNK